ncbi:MAG: hypothetical protein J0M23_04165 [Rickettsiales bacterium]|nr:hypothetical protein [Rickettsiales bacterium]
MASLNKRGVIDEISGAKSFIALIFLVATALSSEIASGAVFKISPSSSVSFDIVFPLLDQKILK